MESEKIIGGIVKFCLIVLFIKFVFFGSWFKSDTHKGPGYSVRKPAGWEVIKDARGVQAVFAATEKPDVVTFAAPEKIFGTEIPVASISVLVVKLANPTWMEDDFPALLDALSQGGFTVIDHGQIKIDNMIFYWVFYRDQESPIVNFEFYTVNDINKLYKIQFVAEQKAFETYRPVFESMKDSIKFSMALW